MGQLKLEKSRVLLCRASATGIEFLKNLVLAGLGSYHILDDKQVEMRDISSNYFLTETCLGQSRGQCSINHLQELNPQVKGRCIQAEPISWLEKHSTRLQDYQLVIVTELTDRQMKLLSKLCHDHGIPVLFLKTYGFLGWIRLQAYEVTIIDPHVESTLMDLRLISPFEELRHYVNSIVWEELDSSERVHIPYVVILIQCLDLWRMSHQGKIPETRDEKEEFKRSILQLRGSHENVEEAIANAHRIWSTTEIPDRVKWCLETSRSMPLMKSLGNFWILMKALVEFVDKQGKEPRLPLNGHIPDMMASTSRYTELQTLYRLGAQRDLQWMRDKTDELLLSIGRPSGSIDQSLLRRFCENSRWLDVIHYVSYYEDDPKDLHALGMYDLGEIGRD